MFEPAPSRVATEGVFLNASLYLGRPGHARLIVLRVAEVPEEEIVCTQLANDVVRLQSSPVVCLVVSQPGIAPLKDLGWCHQELLNRGVCSYECIVFGTGDECAASAGDLSLEIGSERHHSDIGFGDATNAAVLC